MRLAALLTLMAMPALALDVGRVAIDGNQTTVQANATVTASGSAVYAGFANRQVDLFVNIKASPTGTTPTITYAVQEVDPGDRTTLINAAASTAVLSAIGTAQITLPATISPYVKVTWTVTGTTPSFTQVYATLRGKPDPNPAVSTSSGTLSVACADGSINSCGANSFVSIDTSGQFGAWVGLPSSHTITGGTIKVDCSSTGTQWVISTIDDTATNTRIPSKALTSGTAYDASIVPCGGQRYARVRLSAVTSGTGTATLTASLANDPSKSYSGAPGSTVQPPGMVYVGSWDGTNFNPFALGHGSPNADTQRVIVAQKATYQAVNVRTATAAGTGVFFNICGSGTKTVRLQFLEFRISVATTTISTDVVLTKTSAATTAGTATTLTNVPADSNSSAATAVVKYYTALGTAGTAVGKVDVGSNLYPVTGGTVNLAAMTFDYRDRTESESFTLRGTTQCVEAAFGATTTNAPTMSVAVKWTEE